MCKCSYLRCSWGVHFKWTNLIPSKRSNSFFEDVNPQITNRSLQEKWNKILDSYENTLKVYFYYEYVQEFPVLLCYIDRISLTISKLQIITWKLLWPSSPYQVWSPTVSFSKLHASNRSWTQTLCCQTNLKTVSTALILRELKSCVLADDLPIMSCIIPER